MKFPRERVAETLGDSGYIAANDVDQDATDNKGGGLSVVRLVRDGKWWKNSDQRPLLSQQPPTVMAISGRKPFCSLIVTNPDLPVRRRALPNPDKMFVLAGDASGRSIAVFADNAFYGGPSRDSFLALIVKLELVRPNKALQVGFRALLNEVAHPFVVAFSAYRPHPDREDVALSNLCSGRESNFAIASLYRRFAVHIVSQLARKYSPHPIRKEMFLRDAALVAEGAPPWGSVCHVRAESCWALVMQAAHKAADRLRRC
jgi:hypothetical protein